MTARNRLPSGNVAALRVLILAVVLAGTNVHAADKGDTAWLNEPESLLGIPLGQPLEKSIPPCPAQWYKAKEVCYRTDSQPYKVVNLPEPVRWEEVTLCVENGIIEGVYIKFKDDFYQRVRTLFLEKYGAPTYTDSPEYKNLLGATFTKERLLWEGKRVRLTLREAGRKLGISDVIIETQALIATSKERQQQEKLRNLKAL